MFSQILDAPWRLFAASECKTLQTLSQCLLRVIQFPGVTSLVLLCVLYTIAECSLAIYYFAVWSVWGPAFPLSWRLLFLSLFVVPAFSFLHLVLLSLDCLVLWRNRYSSHPRPPQGYAMVPLRESTSVEDLSRALSGAGNDEDRDLAVIEDGRSSSSAPPFEHQAPQHPFSFIWLLQFILWFVLLCTSLWLGLHYQQPGDVRYLPLIENANAYPNRTGYANQEKIFIAAIFYNNEQIIPYWSNSLIRAIHYFGADNVFVSVLESESGDQSPALLQQLDDRLDLMHVSRRIVVRDKTITKPDDMGGNNRIYYLSALRNRALEPLVENGGYDKVVFSNDILIEPESIVELLKTADGEYDMACGMDFSHFGLYDMWVLRDRQGKLVGGKWPYFFDSEDHEAIKTESPVPVFTCWNGIVVFKADPVLPIHLRSNRTLSSDPLPYELPATHPAANNASLLGPSPALTPPARFRASASEECYSSESFLLPYDLRRVFNLQRIFVNPRVIVAYEWRFYAYFKWFMRHPVLKWWIEKMYDGVRTQDVMVVGEAEHVWQWDGGDCHPWW